MYSSLHARSKFNAIRKLALVATQQTLYATHAHQLLATHPQRHRHVQAADAICSVLHFCVCMPNWPKCVAVINRHIKYDFTKFAGTAATCVRLLCFPQLKVTNCMYFVFPVIQRLGQKICPVSN